MISDHNQYRTDTTPSLMVSSHKLHEPRDDLGAYRLLAEIFEIPPMLERLLGQSPHPGKGSMPRLDDFRIRSAAAD